MCVPEPPGWEAFVCPVTRGHAKEVRPVFYLSKLLGSPVKDVENKSAGALHDLVVKIGRAHV